MTLKKDGIRQKIPNPNNKVFQFFRPIGHLRSGKNSRKNTDILAL